MRRIRLGTMMLLVLIAALIVALVAERRRSAALLAEAQAERDGARLQAVKAEYAEMVAPGPGRSGEPDQGGRRSSQGEAGDCDLALTILSRRHAPRSIAQGQRDAMHPPARREARPRRWRRCARAPTGARRNGR